MSDAGSGGRSGKVGCEKRKKKLEYFQPLSIKKSTF